MATVIRVKRRIDEEPLTAFVLNSKKRRFETFVADSHQQQQQQLHSSDTHTTSSSTSTSETNASSTTALPDPAAATSSTVMRFAGTVSTQDCADIATHIRRLTKSDARAAVQHVRKPPTPPHEAALRQRSAVHRQHAHEDRFQIVNCFRTQNGAGGDGGDGELTDGSPANTAERLHKAAETSGTNVTVVDIEKNVNVGASTSAAATRSAANLARTSAMDAASTSASSNHVQSVAAGAQQSQYVYDLYFPATDGDDGAASVGAAGSGGSVGGVGDAADGTHHMDFFIEDLLSIEPWHQPLTYGSARDNGQRGDSSADSEDSNDEGNAANDYPDTEDDDDDEGGAAGGAHKDDDDDDDESVGEADMRRAFNSMEMDDELSSDDENGGGQATSGAAAGRRTQRFVYTIDDDEAEGDGGDVGDEDIDEEVAGRYGVAYARYKARLARRSRRTAGDEDDDDDDEENDDSDAGRRSDDSEADMSEAEADNYYSD